MSDEKSVDPLGGDMNGEPAEEMDLAQRALYEGGAPFPIQPLGNRLIYQRDPTVEISDGGIQMPDVAQVLTLKGSILAIGRGVKELKVGQRICWGVHAGSKMPVDFVPGVERLGTLREDEVDGILVLETPAE